MKNEENNKNLIRLKLSRVRAKCVIVMTDDVFCDEFE